MHRNQPVSTHRFSMVPRADIPRSQFNIQKAHKTTFDAGWLVPIYLDEVLPGDTFNLRMTAFCRLATPLFPVMDNLFLDSFFFFVPNRLVWSNWQKFMGEQENPGDSTSYVIPKMVSPNGGYPVGSIFDHMGLPTAGQVKISESFEHSSLFLRAYNLIFNEWFRDENLIDSVPVNKGDTDDLASDYKLLRRGKRHDYFTSCLPWPQKGPSVPLPLTGDAPVKANAFSSLVPPDPRWLLMSNGNPASGALNAAAGGANQAGGASAYYDPGNSLFADLGEVTAATINQLRQAFQIQKLLERDARGGTRYTEIVRAHFGVISPDARLQRPEYLGGGSVPIVINPIAQTSSTTDEPSPLGNLGAMGTSLANGHGFSQSFTEHGMIIGLLNVRAQLTYQQGLRKMWSRKTRYDFYFPAFASLGEQAVLNKEIFCDGSAADDEVFGYQERWAEYRYNPSEITGLFKSTSAGTIDNWHLAQNFGNLPTLSKDFIEENPPLDRVLAVTSQVGKQLICDTFFNVRAARPLPLYSVPGLIDHF